MATTRHLFATPFVVDAVEGIDLVALRTAIEAERERDEQGLQISNLGGWHSNVQLLEWGGDEAAELVERVKALADAHTVDSRSPEGNRFTWHADMWANVSGKGAANQYHFHPGSYWSAVAYIDDGYAASGDPNLGGELQLQDPRMPMVRMTAPDLRMKEANGQPMHSEVLLRPKTGMIVMFPSWLQHAVRPFHGEGTRISVAINLVPVLKQPG